MEIRRESDRADMEYFLDQVEMVLPVLGFSFLQKRPDRTAAQADRSPEFLLTVAEAEARAQEIDGEFIVLKGSTARREGRLSWTSYKALRDQLIEDSKLVEDSDPRLYRFAEDIAFSSPSAGAAIVAGGNMNGRVSWKLASGKTYQDWHEQKLEAAGGEHADDE